MLTNEQNLNELILHAAGEGIFGLDLEGRHTFVNPAAAKMLGKQVPNICSSQPWPSGGYH